MQMAEEKKIKEQEIVTGKQPEETCSDKPHSEKEEKKETQDMKVKDTTEAKAQDTTEAKAQETTETKAQETTETKDKVKEEYKKPEEKKKPKKKKKSSKDNKEKYQENIEKLQATIADMQDKHLRLQAEFDNYRKRTLKEKMELIKGGGESVLRSLLPVIDDFERALASISKAEDDDPVKQGVVLILKKFEDFLKQNGIKEIEAKGKVFDTDHHEAITKIPAPKEDLKGKVVDVIQKGYLLNDKVIRFAKVIIGE